jgi:hypothetical protein
VSLELHEEMLTTRVYELDRPYGQSNNVAGLYGAITLICVIGVER